jgi:hypothetical protein
MLVMRAAELQASQLAAIQRQHIVTVLLWRPAQHRSSQRNMADAVGSQFGDMSEETALVSASAQTHLSQIARGELVHEKMLREARERLQDGCQFNHLELVERCRYIHQSPALYARITRGKRYVFHDYVGTSEQLSNDIRRQLIKESRSRSGRMPRKCSWLPADRKLVTETMHGRQQAMDAPAWEALGLSLSATGHTRTVNAVKLYCKRTRLYTFHR